MRYNKVRCRALAITITLACCAVTAAADRPTFANVEYANVEYANVEYANVAGESLLLDLYLPSAGGGPYPVVVWIHGGGWAHGSKEGVSDVLPALSSGMAIASINYRLLPGWGFADQVYDCKGAVRFLRAHAATYNLDPARIAAFGRSAGGYHAAMLGVSGDVPELEGDVGGNLSFSSAVMAVAEHAGVADFFTLPTQLTMPGSAPSDFLGLDLMDVIENRSNPAYADEVAWVELASPVTHASGNDPPFNIAHGADDSLVDPAQSQLMYDTLIAAGVEAELHIVPGAPHGLPPETFAESIAFLAEKLSGSGGCGPADLNGDGRVDLTDLGVLLASFGVGSGGDVNGDGRTDLSDLGIVLAAFDEPCL